MFEHNIPVHTCIKRERGAECEDERVEKKGKGEREEE